MMRTPLYIKYTNIKNSVVPEIPIDDLGRSLIGFNKLTKEFAKIINLNGEVNVRATSIRDGSIIIDLMIELQMQIGQLPFQNIDELLSFYKLVNNSLWLEASNHFTSFSSTINSLNEHFKERPFDLALFATLIPALISRIKKLKRKQIDKGVSEEKIEKALMAILKRKIFKDVVAPITEDSTDSIEISNDKKFLKNYARIDRENYQDYLSEDDKILPHLKNAKEYRLKGKITSIKGTRGDSLTFHYRHSGIDFYLDALPEKKKSTKNYLEYYQEEVILNVVISRKSEYVKPKLHILKAEFEQRKLFM